MRHITRVGEKQQRLDRMQKYREETTTRMSLEERVQRLEQAVADLIAEKRRGPG